ncbi:MAG: glycosyltransferase family A protein [Rhodobacteraceae bacterium]|nr:glycosyltransferase family A protein [Paracoccaceae bacterium]
MSNSAAPSPAISVVMVVRNGEKYIEEAIQSILEQTFADFEFIIVDDNSTDNTVSIVQSFADNRIVLTSNPGKPGRIDGLNHGYGIARGKYLANMDADDICTHSRLEVQYNCMESHPEIGILGGNAIAFQSGVQKPSQGTLLKFPNSHSECVHLLVVTGTSSFLNPTTFIRRSAIPEGLEYLHGSEHVEDYKYFCDMCTVTKLANTDNVLVNYRIHPEQVSERFPAVQVRNARKIQMDLLHRLLGENMRTHSWLTNEAHTIALRDIRTFVDELERALGCKIPYGTKSLVKNYVDRISTEELFSNRFTDIVYFLRYKAKRLLTANR